MIVRQIALSNYFAHAHTVLTLPPTGILVLSGINGSGKSVLVDAVSVAVFGKTLRGAAPWADAGIEEAVQVELARDGGVVTVRRGRDKAKTTLACDRLAAGTQTKLQPQLEQALGLTWDVWHRTSVFTSADVSHFALATDAERKRFIEEMLGLGRFDAAADGARSDLRAAEHARQELAQELVVCEHQLAGKRETLAVLAIEPRVSRAEEDRLLGLVVRARETHIAARQALDHANVAHTTALIAHTDEAKSLRDWEQLLAACGSGRCATCGHVIDAAHITGVRGLVELSRARLADREAELRNAQDARATKRDHDEQALREAAQAVSAVAEWQRGAAREALASAKLALAHEKITQLERKQVELRELVANAQLAVAELTAAVNVLGLTGVRARLFDGALAGVEECANAWLVRLGGGLALRLRPFSEKADGGTREAIAVDVTGPHGESGYRGKSTGQRRRIDVALLLALGEVARGALGRRSGTLFLDEVFEGLDAVGVDAAAAAIGELARDRCVVVVAHDPQMLAALPAAVHYRVEEGKLVRA